MTLEIMMRAERTKIDRRGIFNLLWGRARLRTREEERQFRLNCENVEKTVNLGKNKTKVREAWDWEESRRRRQGRPRRGLLHQRRRLVLSLGTLSRPWSLSTPSSWLPCARTLAPPARSAGTTATSPSSAGTCCRRRDPEEHHPLAGRRWCWTCPQPRRSPQSPTPR